MPLISFKDSSRAGIKKALLNREERIVLRSSTRSFDNDNIIQSVLLEDPEIFFVDSYKTTKTGRTVIIEPHYTFPYSDIISLSSQCRDIAIRLVSRTLQENDTYEKVRIVHDLLAKNVVYSGDSPLMDHSIVGPLIKKRAVCDGFSRAFKYLLDQIHIPCVVVTGKAINAINGSWESHAWNLVNMNGKWTHVDVTYDTTVRVGNVLRYDYFGLPDSWIKVDHKPSETDLPEASSEEFEYYRRNGLYVGNKSSLRMLTRMCINTKQRRIVVRLPMTTTINGLEKQVLSALQEIRDDTNTNLQYTLYFNSFQRVFHIELF